MKRESEFIDKPENLIGHRPNSWWTGKPPQFEICPGVNKAGIIRSLPQPNLKTCTRQQVMDYFDNTWTLTEVLFSSLQTKEAFLRPPYHQLRHPLIFYYCHPVALYVNKARLAGLITEAINPYFEQLFETGVDEMSWDDLSKNQLDWPSLTEIHSYRRQIYHLIQNIIDTHPDLDNLPITQKNPFWAIFMGFEHERIHLETSSVLIRELPIHLVKKPEQWPEYYKLTNDNSFPINKLITVDAGMVSIGKPKEWPSYGWDNEYGHREIKVDPFRATQFLISNGDFLEFVKAGGYQKPHYWTDEGWKWRTFRNAKWPTFWIPDGPAGLHQFKLRLCFDIVSMQNAWPVDVNYHEAKAYAAWASENEKKDGSYRVLTEAEHHRLRSLSKENTIMVQSGHEMHEKKLNMNLAFGSQTPVNFNLSNANGFADVFGNIWEWCEDHFAPLPGFDVHALYDDFSSPCFDGKHNIIMGGSFISTGDEASSWARFHFRRHFFQHAGFRLAHSIKTSTPLVTTCLDAPPPYVGNGPCCSKQQNISQNNSYESQRLLNQYLLLHFGNYENTLDFALLPQNVIEFPKRCAQLLNQIATDNGIVPNKVLDLGCAVGGASFELAKTFNEVIGIDLSHLFISTAKMLKQEGTIDIILIDEGDFSTKIKISIDPKINRNRVTFQIGDACALPIHLGKFNAILLANLLCRLPSPKACLARLTGPMSLLEQGGILLITSPYSWLSTHTHPSAWLCDATHTSIENLHHILDNDFMLIYETNMPLILREHARKFEYIISHATAWMKK